MRIRRSWRSRSTPPGCSCSGCSGLCGARVVKPRAPYSTSAGPVRPTKVGSRGIPTADGILADIGGGSLSWPGSKPATSGEVRTLPIGVLRAGRCAGNDATGARRAIVEGNSARVPWLAEGAGRDLCIVGGTCGRSRASTSCRPLPAEHGAPLHDGRDEARDLAASSPGRRARAGAHARRAARRVDDLPSPRWCCAACCARPAPGAWYSAPTACARAGTWSASPRHARRTIRCWRPARVRHARGPRPGPAPCPAGLDRSTVPPGTGESAVCARPPAGCPTSAATSSRISRRQAFLRIFRQPGIGLDHHARAFLGLTLALRYEAETDAPFLAPARALLSPERSGAPPSSAWRFGSPTRCPPARRPAGGNAVAGRPHADAAPGGGHRRVRARERDRRLDRLAQALGLDATTELAALALSSARRVTHSRDLAPQEQADESAFDHAPEYTI